MKSTRFLWPRGEKKPPRARSEMRALLLAGFSVAHLGPALSAEPQVDEIALALSACPASLAGGAAVYVLGPSGYVKVRDGNNGFTALVQHTVPDAREPRCMGKEGARSWLPRILKIAQLRAQGKSREEIQANLADALAKGDLAQPASLGVDYMLSKQNLAPNQQGAVVPFPPHIMFYAPGLTNKDIGVDNTRLGPDGNPAGPVFIAGEGTPYALLIVHVTGHDVPTAPDAGADRHPVSSPQR